MAKGSKAHRRGSRAFRWQPYPLHPSCSSHVAKYEKECTKLDKDWEDVTCSVCMECPHNAVLLLCASHDKGCRPYMCGTSFRYSNCLDQYKKAYTKVATSTADDQNMQVKCELSELACPLCRGKVKGWTVVEPAREYLNAKKRNCMQDSCSFVGTYKELRKHMKANHPSAQPREIDPALQQKWRRLESEQEHDDVISSIRSTMPGAMVFGDYVIERNQDDFDLDELPGFDVDATDMNPIEVGFDRNLVNVFLWLHALGLSRGELSRRLRQSETVHGEAAENMALATELGNNEDDDGDGGAISFVSRLRRHGRMLLGRSGRRRRRREVNATER